MKSKLLVLTLGAALLASCGNAPTPTSSSSSSSSKEESSSSSTAPSSSSSSSEGSSSSSEESSSSSEESSSSSSQESSSISSSEEPSYIDTTVRLEGEAGVLDGDGVKRSSCPNASGKLMAADINNCGQGLEWIHFAPVGGKHDAKIAYWTGMEGSKMSLLVNGVVQNTIYYNDANGWATGSNEASIVEFEITLDTGYNNIQLIKHGFETDVPSYGGYAQIDYLDIIGTETEFDPSIYDLKLSRFTLEAERGHFHTGGLPFLLDTASSFYAVGEINAPGHGTDLTFVAPASGNYSLSISYSQGSDGNVAGVTFGTEVGLVNLPHYDGQAYNVINTVEAGISSFLTKGQTVSLNVVRASSSADWFVLDSFTMTLIAE